MQFSEVNLQAQETQLLTSEREELKLARSIIAFPALFKRLNTPTQQVHQTNNSSEKYLI